MSPPIDPKIAVRNSLIVATWNTGKFSIKQLAGKFEVSEGLIGNVLCLARKSGANVLRKNRF